MGIESAGTQSERSTPEAAQELAALETTLAELRLVQQSIHTEEDGLYAAQGSAREAASSEQQVSDETVRAALSENRGLTDADHTRLQEAREERTEADEWNSSYKENYSMDTSSNELRDVDGPLAEKLRRLGVDVETYKNSDEFRNNSIFWDKPLENAILARAHELTQLIREKKLEVTGGKDELIIEAMRKSGALSQESIQKLGDMFSAIHVANPSISEIYAAVAPVLKDISDYPSPVKEGVLRQMVQQAAKESRSDIDQEEMVRSLTARINVS